MEIQNYFCGKCGFGSVSHNKNAGVVEVVHLIEDDHKKRSPGCTIPIKLLKIMRRLKMNDKTRTKIMKLAIGLFEDGHEPQQITDSISELYHKDKIEPIRFVVGSAIEMYKSLVIAVDKAGGSGWPVDELLEMTVMDLISKLATNGIRFTFETLRRKKSESRKMKKLKVFSNKRTEPDDFSMEHSSNYSGKYINTAESL